MHTLLVVDPTSKHIGQEPESASSTRFFQASVGVFGVDNHNMTQ